MPMPCRLAQRTSRCRAITATDSAISRSTRRAPIRHPPSTFGRVSTSSHTLTTRSSRQLDLWTTPPLTSPKAALHALAVIAAKQALRPLRSAAADGPSESWSNANTVVNLDLPSTAFLHSWKAGENGELLLAGRCVFTWIPDAASWSGERRIRFDLFRLVGRGHLESQR
jgi:hypothetical protein